MKKILTVLLTTLMVMAIPANVFAQEGDNVQEISSTSATLELYAKKASSYTIKLPSKVDVSSTSTTVSISACGNVSGSEQIVIEENKGESGTTVNYLQDVTDLKDDKALTVSVDTAISGTDITADYNQKAVATMTITHDELDAGDYTCNLPITIKLETI